MTRQRIVETDTPVTRLIDEHGRCVARIAELEAALRVARGQLVTLGGESLHAHGDNIQRAVLNEIDKALSR